MFGPAIAVEIVEAERRADVLAVRRLLRRIERGEVLRAIHEAACNGSSVTARANR